ncbi:metallophosphoesterase [Dactylosporangium sp. NPDC050688]|uniref:metallophosphoesterase n=1 Tax=Dactylosporangium sp. NPDC050688 TaxID=3157217 RepID=UPI0033F2296F
MRPNPILFFGVVTALAVAIHLYLWWRLVRSTARSRRNRRIGAAVIGGLGAFGLVGLLVTRTVGVDTRWLAWIGYGWIAVMFYLLLTLLVLEIPRGAYALWLRRTAATAPDGTQQHSTQEQQDSAPATAAAHGGPVVTAPARTRPRPTAEEPGDAPDPGRRLFIARACALAACGVAAGAVGAGMRTAFGDLRTVRVTTPITGLDPRLAGFRIAAVSDTHFGPFMREPLAERIVTAINREQVDMVVVLGDLADGSVEEVGYAAEPMRRFESRKGTFFVTGNHDYSSGVDPWVERVRELGMRPLLNERVEITSGGAAFDLAGVNDLFATMYDKQGPDFAAALNGRDPARALVLLAHQPVQVHEAVKYGVDLQLSGHTHGGQTVPFDRIAGLQQPVLAGLARRGDTSLFVTRGAGFFGPPIRAGIPPEVAIVQLQPRG